MYMGQALKSPNCKVVIFMISRNSLNSVPILEELCYATKSETIKENNAGQPLKVLPVVIDKDWPETNDDRDIKTWINNVVSLDNQPLNSSDLTIIQNLYLDLGRGAFKKNIYSGFDRIERKGQVSKTICSEILESNNGHMQYGSDASSLTLIFNRAGVVTQIINNISKYLVISEISQPPVQQITPPQPVKEKTSDTSDSESGEKLICSKCGFEMKPNSKFCPKCGQRVGSTVQTITQPQPVQEENPRYNSPDYVNPFKKKTFKDKLSGNKIVAFGLKRVLPVIAFWFIMFSIFCDISDLFITDNLFMKRILDCSFSIVTLIIFLIIDKKIKASDTGTLEVSQLSTNKNGKIKRKFTGNMIAGIIIFSITVILIFVVENYVKDNYYSWESYKSFLYLENIILTIISCITTLVFLPISFYKSNKDVNGIISKSKKIAIIVYALVFLVINIYLIVAIHVIDPDFSYIICCITIIPAIPVLIQNKK